MRELVTPKWFPTLKGNIPLRYLEKSGWNIDDLHGKLLRWRGAMLQPVDFYSKKAKAKGLLQHEKIVVCARICVKELELIMYILRVLE